MWFCLSSVIEMNMVVPRSPHRCDSVWVVWLRWTWLCRGRRPWYDSVWVVWLRWTWMCRGRHIDHVSVRVMWLRWISCFCLSSVIELNMVVPRSPHRCDSVWTTWLRWRSWFCLSSVIELNMVVPRSPHRCVIVLMPLCDMLELIIYHLSKKMSYKI